MVTSMTRGSWLTPPGAYLTMLAALIPTALIMVLLIVPSLALAAAVELLTGANVCNQFLFSAN